MRKHLIRNALLVVAIFVGARTVWSFPGLGKCRLFPPVTVQDNQCVQSNPTTYCLSDATYTCLPWCSGCSSYKKWLAMVPNSYCQPSPDPHGGYTCQECTSPDAMYCAWGKKYATLANCNANTNAISQIWGYRSDICK